MKEKDWYISTFKQNLILSWKVCSNSRPFRRRLVATRGSLLLEQTYWVNQKDDDSPGFSIKAYWYRAEASLHNNRYLIKLKYLVTYQCSKNNFKVHSWANNEPKASYWTQRPRYHSMCFWLDRIESGLKAKSRNFTVTKRPLKKCLIHWFTVNT